MAVESAGMARRAMSPRALAGEVSGGLTAALVAIPQAMSLGLLAFAALGPSYVSAGIVAGLFASVAGNLVTAAVYGAPGQIVSARASTTVVFAALLASLAAHPALQTPGGPDVPRIITLAFLCVLLSGALQLVFAYAGLGRAIKLVPYPVIAGFMNGIALIILALQAAPALGLEPGRSLLEAVREPAAIRPASIAVTAAVLATIVLAPRVTRRVPAVMCGLVAGILVHYAAATIAPASTGPAVGPLPDISLAPRELAAMADLLSSREAGGWLALVLPHAVLLALVASLDGLLASVVADAATQTRHDGKRVLAGQGIANALGAAAGALPALVTPGARITNYRAGGHTRLSALFHALLILAATAGLGPLFAAVPVAVLAGIMIYTAWTLLDGWTRDLLRRLRADHQHRTEILVNLAIVFSVAFSLLFFNMMVAFTVGVAAAVALLLVKLSGSPVRRILDGTARASLKIRAPAARAALQVLARQIRVVELEGTLFFGTADRVQGVVERLPSGTRFVILDFRRVHEIDASGARVLDVIAQEAERRGMRLLLSEVRTDEPRGKYLEALGMASTADRARWFPDLDRALEWAEDRLLEQARFEDGAELAPMEMPLFANLDERERAMVTACLERHEHGNGDPVFQEGDRADRVYLIARGAVSIKVTAGSEIRALRLATFSPGVFFGEMALFEGGRRTADAYAKGERVILYSLSAGAIARLVREHPGLGVKIYESIARELVARLRVTTGALRALE